MSLEAVRAYFQDRAPDIEIIETEASSSTVELAAKAHRVEPGQLPRPSALPWARRRC